MQQQKQNVTIIPFSCIVHINHMARNI